MTRDQPNILLLFPDQHRGDWLPYDESIFARIGVDPVPVRMPTVRGLMDRGVTFTEAITPAPLCAPARGCLASGLRYEHCGVSGNDVNYPVTQRAFYAVLRDAGYNVGSVGKLDVRKPEHNWTLSGWVQELGQIGFTRAVDSGGKWDAIFSATKRKVNGKWQKLSPDKYAPAGPYMEYLRQHELMHVHIQDLESRRGAWGRYNVEPTPLPEHAYTDNWVGQGAINLLSEFPRDQPWFLQVNFPSPHDPWDVTTRMRAAWEEAELPPPHGGNEFLREEENLVRQNYAAMIENIDRNAGEILAAIAERGEIDDTLVIYSSDHGEMLGDLTKYGKSTWERGAIHVPLVVAGSGVQAGVTCDALVELQDLTATFVEYAGSSMPEARDSWSLTSLLAGETKDHRRYQVSALDDAKHDWLTVKDAKHKVVLVAGSAPQLFDLEQDPWCDENIAAENSDVIASLLAQYAAEPSAKFPEGYKVPQ